MDAVVLGSRSTSTKGQTRIQRLKGIVCQIEKQYGQILELRQEIEGLELAGNAATTCDSSYLDVGHRTYPDQPIRVWMHNYKIVAGYVHDMNDIQDGSIAYCGGLVLVDPDVPIATLTKMTCDEEHTNLFKFLNL